MKRLAILGFRPGLLADRPSRSSPITPDRFQVLALTAGRNVHRLAEQARQLKPELVVVENADSAKELRGMISNSIEVMVGDEGLIAAATHPQAELVVVAVVGELGAFCPPLLPSMPTKTLAGHKQGVISGRGELVMAKAKERQVRILPIDSEHSAVFQCLQGQDPDHLAKIILTASGGPFRTYTNEQLEVVTPKEALRHPNWDMGGENHH